MVSILVTGGAGFIGSNFILERLQLSKELIINLDKLTYAGNLANLAQIQNDRHYCFIEGSIGDVNLITALCAQYKPRAVINFAAETHVDRSIANPQIFVQTNMLDTFNLLEAIRGYWSTLASEDKALFRLLHVSTDEVYGSLDVSSSPFTEESAYKPNSPYAASKAASDHLVRVYHHTYGLPVLTSHASNNYGPHQDTEKLIPKVIHQCLTGGMIPIYGNGQQIRDWLYVADHCKALESILLLGQIGESYNTGSQTEKTNLEVVNLLCDLLDDLHPRLDGLSYQQQISFVEDRPGHDTRYAINASKLERELGWKPEVSFEHGLGLTIKWYLQQYQGNAAVSLTRKPQFVGVVASV